jgi:hypothetical protein
MPVRIAALSLIVSSIAWAAEPITEILPVGDVVGDGETEATVHVLLQYGTGAPVTGLSLRASADGTKPTVGEVGGGLYVVRFAPESVDQRTPLELTVRGKAPEIGPIELKRTVIVQPAHAPAVALTSNPPKLVLGQDAESTLSFSAPSVLGEPAEASDLMVRVSSGTVGDLVPLGNGRFTARYTAPTVNYPHIAIFTVIDRRDPEGTATHLALPLQGKVDYPVLAAPGSNVILRVAGREFGPSVAGSDGRVSVPVIVPPGVQTATQVTVAEGKVEETDLDLRVPEIRRLQLHAMPPSVPSDARVRVPVLITVLDPMGAPDDDAKVDLVATAGQITRPKPVGNGLYQAEYIPPDGRVTMAATIQATVPGGTVQSDGVEFTLTPAMPVRMTLSTEPEVLAPSATALEVFARVQAADGTGLPGRALRFDALGATQQGELVDLKGGDYRASFLADPDSSVVVRGSVLAADSRNTVQHVVLLSDQDVIAADGMSTQPLTIVTTDAFGIPVPGAEVTLRVMSGGGKVPSTVTTDANGQAEVYYTAGGATGLAEIQATSEGHLGAIGLLQGYQVAPTLPPSGTLSDIFVADALRATSATVRVTREGATAVATKTETQGGTVAKLALTAEPTVVAPGGTVEIVVRATDALGDGVSGAQLDVLSGGGATPGTLVDEGGGTYRGSITASADAKGAIKVSVLGPGGSPASVVEIPVIGGAVAEAGPWSTDPGTQVAPTPEAPEAPAAAAPVEPTPAPPDEILLAREKKPWFRLKGAVMLSSYAFVQQPGDDPQTLLPSSLGWGGDNGRGATPLGGEGRLKLHVPTVPYIGFDGLFRASRYTVAADLFEEAASDTLFDIRANLVGRAPIRAGRDAEVSLGARVGFRWDDFVTFVGCVDPGCVVEYQPLAIPGLNTGVEIGFEAWKMFGIVSGDVGFAYGTQPYAVNVDADLGFQITKNVFVDLGFGWRWRTGEVLDGETADGNLADQQFLGSLGVGLSL